MAHDFSRLAALWIAKSVGGGLLGTALATVAMGLQLYLPIRWLHRTLQPDSVIGWHRRALPDLKLVASSRWYISTLRFGHVWAMENARSLALSSASLNTPLYPEAHLVF